MRTDTPASPQPAPRTLQRSHALIGALLCGCLLLLTGAGTARAAIESHDASTGSNVGGGATTLSVAKPANVVSGSFLLAQVTFEKGLDVVVSPVHITPPNGWSLVQRDDSHTDIGQAIFSKTAGASEPASYVWEFKKKEDKASLDPLSVRASGGVVRYTGVDTASPVVADLGLSGDSSSLRAPSVAAEENSMLLVFFGIKKRTSLSTPGGMTSTYFQQHSNGSGPSIRAVRELRASGATGDRTSTAGESEKWVAQQVALRPLSRASQTITFAQPADQTYGAADVDLSATASSGLAVSYAASPATVCTIVAGKVRLAGVGTCTVTASQAGDASHLPAADVTRTFQVTKASQAITFGALPSRTFGDASFTLAATGGSSGNPVTYALGTGSAGCSLSGINGATVTITGATGAGEKCIIVASQAGNADYAAAPSVTRDFAIAKASQTITFTQPANQPYGAADIAPGAAASSGLAVSYTASPATVCTIVSGKVRLAGGGTCSVTASQAGNANYLPAADVTRSFQVTKASQAITFGALPDRTYGDESFTLTATGGDSGNPIRFALGTGSVGCSLSGTNDATVTITGATGVGEKCIIVASQAGNADYEAAAGVTRDFTIAKASQTITFAQPADQAYGDADVAPGATASSDLTVSYTASPATVCTIVSGKVHLVGVGTCSVTASQAGNANYAAAASVTREFDIAKASQTIDFGALADKTYGDADVAPGATASSDLTVSYTASPATVCTIVSGKVHLAGVGTCSVTASQAGNANYASAPSVTRDFTIAKASQTITFGALSNKTFGAADSTLTATGGSSGNPVTYALGTGSVGCSLSGTNDATVTITGATGSGEKCIIVASQAGTANYEAAPSVTRDFTIAKASQTIDFGALADRTYGDADVPLGATASSELTVSYAASPATVCTIVSGKVRLAGAGTCSVTASQAGNANYAAAPSVTRELEIAKASQTIDFDAPADRTFGDADVPLGATATSGLTVSYAASPATVCAIVSGKVRLVGAGTCSVTASQAGNANYAAATGVTRDFEIAKASQTIDFDALADKTYGDADVAPGATATSGLAVSYAASPADVCTIVSGKIRLVGVGTCSVTASQAGNANYEAAPSITRDFEIAKASQTIEFGALPDRTFGAADFTLSATGGKSGNPVSFALGTGSVGCSLSGTTVTITGATAAGEKCIIVASQAGTANYEAAPSVTRDFTIAKASQTITFGALSNKTYGDADVTLTATGGRSGNPVTYELGSGSAGCSLSGTTVTITGATGAGEKCIIVASQAGTANYAAAPSVTRDFTIAKAVLTVTADDHTMTYADAVPQLTYKVAGFVNGETPATSGVTGAPALSTTATSSSGAGSYAIAVASGQLASANYGFRPVNGTLTVAKRAASVEYTGANYAVIAAAGNATINLSAKVSRSGSLGDLSLARVEFVVKRFNGSTQTTVYAMATASGIAATTASVPNSDDPYTIEVRVDPANLYWTSGIDVATLQVIVGSGTGRTAGGGWIPDAANTLNGKSNFGFTVQNAKTGIKGNSVFVFRALEGGNQVQYVVKSNSWQGGGLAFNVNTDPTRATFTGRANVQRYVGGVLDTSFSGGNHSFTVDVIDGDLLSPKQQDRYAITVRNSSNAIVKQLGSRTTPVPLGGGNVLVQRA